MDHGKIGLKMEQNDFNKVKNEYKQKQLEYEIAKTFYNNIPYLKFAQKIIIFSYIVTVVLYAYNRMDFLDFFFLVVLGNAIPFLLLFAEISASIINKTKINKSYLDKVKNEIEQKLKSKYDVSIIRSTTINLLNELSKHKEVPSCIAVYQLFESYKKEFATSQCSFKKMQDKISKIKQNNQIQEYINQYNH